MIKTKLIVACMFSILSLQAMACPGLEAIYLANWGITCIKNNPLSNFAFRFQCMKGVKPKSVPANKWVSLPYKGVKK